MRNVIGLDAASDRRKFGYAVGRYSQGRVTITRSGLLGSATCIPSDLVAALTSGPTLVAIDAPLGWPNGLRDSLVGHAAGEPLVASKNMAFRRLTDRRIRLLRHLPLEIGADRIARAAHEALSVLNQLRREAGQPIPMLWAADAATTGVIEVYPAATLKAHGLASTGYKKPEQVPNRRLIAAAIEHRLVGIGERCNGSADEFDACLCLLAASDFISGECHPPAPSELPAARREGWIWLRGQADADPSQ